MSFYGERFRYFCTPTCHERFDPHALSTPVPRPSSEPPRTPVPPPTPEPPPPAEPVEAPITADEGRAPPEPVVESEPAPLEVESPSDETRSNRAPAPEPASDVATGADVGTLLLGLSVLAGVLGVTLSLAGDSSLALSARLVLAGVSCAALAAECLLGRRELTELNPFALLAAPLAATLVAIVTRATGDARAGDAVTLAALIVACSAASALLMRRASRPFEEERLRIVTELDQPTHRVAGNEVTTARAADLRPGEEMVIEAGEIVSVAATVTAGTATVSPRLAA